MKRLSLLLGSALLAASAMAGTPPEYQGGEAALMEYFITNIRYPQTALDNGIEGTVLVTFNVQPDGTLRDVKIERPLDPDLEAEAIRVVTAMPGWTPATDDTGTPIAVPVTIPIKFRLPSE